MPRHPLALGILLAGLLGCGRLGYDVQTLRVDFDASVADGSGSDADTWIINADGALTSSDGALTSSDGALTSSDGALTSSDGRVSAEAGATDGSMLDAGTNDASRDGGPVIAPDGAVPSPLAIGNVDQCANGFCVSDVDMCAATAAATPGICGCGGDDAVDSDSDGAPDCIDACPGQPDRYSGGACGCIAATADMDMDGALACNDLCPNDRDKTLPGLCGCGVPDSDSDSDSIPDCADQCPGVPDGDRDDDGIYDCVDTCGGSDDSRYVPTTGCGVGYCASTATPSSCVSGVEIACAPGAPRSGDDTTCDDVDDDCSGAADEDYVANSSCGVGWCRTTNAPSRCSNGVESVCVPGTPRSALDDTQDGIDDDCDGQVDEDVCAGQTRTYPLGQYDFAPPSGCATATIMLWGGGGASGSAESGYWGGGVHAGSGGSGGFAQATITFGPSDAIRLQVGQGGQGCGGAGTQPNASVAGGAGSASGDASNGRDGSEVGGNGANPASGGNGGRGSFGGGGGGAGSSPFSRPGGGGGGGAGSSLFVNGSRVMVAGGGGGGGGAGSNITTIGRSGGAGGPGCGGAGVIETHEGGGGGGGGLCRGPSGVVTQRGSGATPHVPNGVSVPGRTALGGAETVDCQTAGDGYAIFTWSR